MNDFSNARWVETDSGEAYFAAFSNCGLIHFEHYVDDPEEPGEMVSECVVCKYREKCILPCEDSELILDDDEINERGWDAKKIHMELENAEKKWMVGYFD